MSAKFFLIFAMALALGGCPPSGNNNSPTTSASPTGGFPVPLAQQIPDTRVFPPKPAPTNLIPCPPGTFDLTRQQIEPPQPGVTATLTVDQAGPTEELADGEIKISVRVPDGTKFSAVVKPLDPRCNAAPDILVAVTFGLNYRAVVEVHPNEPFVCIFRSRTDYSSFTVTLSDSTVLGEPVEIALQNKIKDEVLKNLDLQAADQTNRRLRNNTPLPSGADPRCSWRELDADGVVRR